MRYLLKLVTPKGGVILDPFAGSGTTGCAAEMENIKYVMMESEREYMPVLLARLKHWHVKGYEERSGQRNLFD